MTRPYRLQPLPPVKFAEDAMERAADAWRANCGPAALAAATVRSIDEVRGAIPGFEGKGFTNPTMMSDALKGLGIRFRSSRPENSAWPWPDWGICRIQWHGPWTAPGVPPAAAYRYTHWVAARGTLRSCVFEVSAIGEGGWVDEKTWRHRWVPEILAAVSPKATSWSVTHVLEFAPPVAGVDV